MCTADCWMLKNVGTNVFFTHIGHTDGKRAVIFCAVRKFGFYLSVWDVFHFVLNGIEVDEELFCLTSFISEGEVRNQ